MYFATRQHGPLGPEVLTATAIIGHKISFRRAGNYRDFQNRAKRQTMTYTASNSRFGAIRELIRQSRMWQGRIFFLDVLEITPIWQATYTPECLLEEGN